MTQFSLNEFILNFIDLYRLNIANSEVALCDGDICWVASH